MKILFVTDKCHCLYRAQMTTNLQAILGERHDVVFFKATSKKYLERIKTENPDIIYLLIGGTQHNEIAEQYKGTNTVIVSDMAGNLDIQINGEPELVFPLLVEAIETGADLSTVPGITYEHKTKKAEKWDINQVVSNESFVTFSSRGCKGKCSFCSIRNYQGSLRLREIPVIVEDIIRFGKYDDFHGDFYFSDPSFDSNPKKRMKELLKTLIKEFCVYTYQANFRPDFHKMVDDEMIQLLFDSGLTRAFIGVESGNESDLQLYNKGTTVEDAQKTIDLFKNLDCAVDAGFIMFNPFSDFDRLRQNIAFLKKNHLATFETLTRQLSIAPAAPIEQITIEAGLLISGQSCYLFKDEKMLLLTQTIKLIEKGLHQNALAQYRDLGLKAVKRLKREILFRDSIEKYNKLIEYDQRLTEIVERESDRLCEWFLNLLDLMEQKRPYIEFFQMTNNYITTEHIKSVVKEYHAISKEMYGAYGGATFLKRI